MLCMYRAVSNEQYVFHLHRQFKQARVGNETLTITLPAYKDDIRLCIGLVAKD